MLRLSCALWLVGFGLACGDDQPSQADSAERDAGDDAAAASGRLEKLLSQWIDEWDRQMTTQCACLVESGAYKSQDECFEFLRSGSDWLQCISSALADSNSPETLATGKCVLDQIRLRNECLESTTCGSEDRAHTALHHDGIDQRHHAAHRRSGRRSGVGLGVDRRRQQGRARDHSEDR